MSSFLSHHKEGYNVIHCAFEKRIIALTANNSDEVHFAERRLWVWFPSLSIWSRHVLREVSVSCCLSFYTAGPTLPGISSSTYFHLLACARKRTHLCVFCLHLLLLLIHCWVWRPSCSSAPAHTTSGCTGIPEVWILAPLSPCELHAPKLSPPAFLSRTEIHPLPDAQHSASSDHRV